MLVRKLAAFKALTTCLAASPAYALAVHPPVPVVAQATADAALANPEQMRNIEIRG